MAIRTERREPTKHYGQWATQTPTTDPKAEVVAWRKAKGVTAIHVAGARYRNSLPLNGAFEMLSEPKEDKNGVWQVEVCCAWHGVTPPNSFPNLTVQPGAWRFESNFNCDVADNIARP